MVSEQESEPQFKKVLGTRHVGVSASEVVKAKLPEILADNQANLQVEPSLVSLVRDCVLAEHDDLKFTVKCR